MRVTVDLPLQQLAALSGYCESEGITRAEGVRRAVRLLLAFGMEENLVSAFGAWRGQDIDGVAYQRAIRAEWDD